jgi:hypothetical protein
MSSILRELAVLYAAVAVVHLLPVWTVPIIPTVDGPSHVYNAVVLQELARGSPEFAAVFAADLRPHPNWLGHALLFVALYVAPPVVAEKLVFTVIIIVFLAGVWAFAGLVDARSRVYAFLAMPLTFHLLLQMGFYNYSLGCGLALLAVAAAWRGRGTTTALLLVVCYLAHALPAAVAVLSVLIFAAARRRWRDLVSVTPVALLFGWFLLQPKLPGGDWTWNGAILIEPLLRVALLHTFDPRQLTFGTILGLVYGALVVVTLLVERIDRQRRDVFLLLTLAAVGLYLAAPVGVQEGFVLKARLLLFPYLFILPWFTPRVPRLPLALAFALVASANAIFIRNCWKQNADVMTRAVSVVGAATPGKTAVPLIFDRSSPHASLPLLSHAFAHAAAARRLVDLGNYEAALGFFPVAFRKGIRRPSIFQLETAPESFDVEAYKPDYIYTWRMPERSALEPKLLEHYELRAIRGEARLYARRRFSASSSHPRRSRSSATLERYGLMSRMGVPSSMSTPRTRRRDPSRPSSSTTVRPIGLGRHGERVANTPWGRSSQGGVPINS